MQTLFVVNLFIFVVVGAVGSFWGFDIRNWRSWLYGLYGFVSGFLIGYVFVDSNGGAKLGLLFAFAVMYAGATTYQHRQRFK